MVVLFYSGMHRLGNKKSTAEGRGVEQSRGGHGACCHRVKEAREVVSERRKATKPANVPEGIDHFPRVGKCDVV